MEDELGFFTLSRLSDLVSCIVMIRSTERRTRSNLLEYIRMLPPDSQRKIRELASLESAGGKKRKATEHEVVARKKRRKLNEGDRTSSVV